MTQTPETQPENQTPAAAGDSTLRRRWLKSLASSMRTPRQAFNTIYTFMNELSRDHTFWLHMMAVRSGAAMTVLTVAGACAYAMTLPFTLAATVIVGVAVLAGAATVGIVAGTRFILGRMRAAYDSMKNGETANPSVPAPPVPAASDRPFYRTINKIAELKIIKTIGQTRIWATTERFIREQKKWMLGGTALSGAALTTGMSAWVLAAQLAVLPVVAIGSAVSFVALWAVAGVVSGCAGLYFGSKSLIRWHRVTRAEKAAARMIASNDMTTPDARGQAPVSQLSSQKDFAQSATPAPTSDSANDNIDTTPKAATPAAPKKK